ncbi:hypothetical protein BATDEDRAFT_35893 [Batrachochytrium dendrobatidis JAM81]|uniref:Dipeptidyl-peptidase V n=1 Tax=Batrachochytrium dendrobatidis (strain JAM81 / FGSC 10211) TaxID=684364 RepID=F4PAG7_BATDJ|nr:uncharacterized protein BATDEDRAFT_35893 [Batrachochytrium dendrobatidis JAM81]EGF77537.1 hypothetical protein BATDEDRAFT_35893 [Batrachochytrium dendrobatidis JAM81]KAK5666095.1 Dipeptidyl-peptidase 5 [Batrachochytrium dendrobatidis]|eukprot:XP_006681709.1 hypothetical protein BATDEDRAFT_35893 [Batrachochytrium dendrobatidis JAM81]
MVGSAFSVSRILLLVSSCCLVSADFASYGFTAEDLVSMHKLSNPVVSPKGHMTAYTVSHYNTSTTITTRSLYLSHLPQSESEHPNLSTPETALATGPVLVGSDVGSDPFWMSDSVLAVLCSREGLNQICVSNITNALEGTPVEFKQITQLVHGVTTAKYHTASGLLAFTSTVVVAPNPRKVKGSSAMVYDKLFVRHWDTYLDPTARSHLFVARLTLDALHTTVVKEGDVVDLFTSQPDLETPVAPFGSTTDYDFSPDGTTIVFTSRVPERKAAWNTNTDVYTILTDGTQPPVSLSKKNLGADSLPTFSPSGDLIAWLQMREPGYESDKNVIVVYNRIKATQHILTKKWDRSPSSVAFLSETLLVITAQDKGHNRVFTVDITTDKVVERYSDSTLHSISVVPGTNTFTALSNSMLYPDKLVVMDMEKWTVAFLTHFNDEHLASRELALSEEFWFKGAKNEKVHGWLLKPHYFNKDKKYPLAFLIHGGPEGAWNDDWSYRWNPQVFAAQGYFVAVINFHGSTGFGSEFTRSILGNWGGAPFEDNMKGLKYVLEQNPQIDHRRVAALGASYGGFMINWINGHSKKFACLVNHDGIFDPRSAYFSTEELFFKESEFKGTPYDRKAAKLYEKYSPALYSHKWVTPTLVIHSERDYRLPITEGLATFTALQRRGVPSRLLYFPDENHWVLKPANSLQWHAEVFEWIGQYTSESRVAGISTQHDDDMDDMIDNVVSDESIQRWVIQGNAPDLIINAE